MYEVFIFLLALALAFPSGWQTNANAFLYLNETLMVGSKNYVGLIFELI
jgi:hypothetical protein